MTGSAAPILYIFSGLPGTGKSTLAKVLAKETKAIYIRIDTIEQGLRDLTGLQVVDEGYRLAYRIARDNLLSGISVVADSCNPIEITRIAWMGVAASAECPFVNIEVLCSDGEEHRRRVEGRDSQIEGLRLPTWQDVQNREFDPWVSPRIIVETAGKSLFESFKDLLAELRH